MLTLIMGSPWEFWESSWTPDTKFLLWEQYCRPDSSMVVQSFSSWGGGKGTEQEAQETHNHSQHSPPPKSYLLMPPICPFPEPPQANTG